MCASGDFAIHVIQDHFPSQKKVKNIKFYSSKYPENVTTIE